MTAMGKYGLRELAVQNHAKAMFLKRQLGNINGIFVTEDPIFNEFTIKLDRPASAVLDALEKRGIQGGVDLGRFDSTRDNEMLIAVTELNTRAQLDAYCQAMEAVL